MKKVFFHPLDTNDPAAVSRASKTVMEKLFGEVSPMTAEEFPLKVHFGEEGNKTFIPADCYNGIIDILKERGVNTSFIETNVLYSGRRMKKEDHIKLASEHGFTQIPVRIADGDRGEYFSEVEIAGKRFKSCKIAGLIAALKQMAVCSHFKGHMLAGFGGAVKQLAMGCASRGGKLAQHAGSKPVIIKRKCVNCGLCAKNCPVSAIGKKDKHRINKDICIGCAACMAICPQEAVQMDLVGAFSSVTRVFLERLAEYAYAAAKDKNIYYINFALNITRGCDCEKRPMKPFLPDLGILGSLDPVAVDHACITLLEKRARRRIFRGRHTLSHAEHIGLGKNVYDLITIGS